MSSCLKVEMASSMQSLSEREVLKGCYSNNE